MKQNYIFKRTLFALVLLMASTLSWAYDFEAKNAAGVTIYYRLINDGTEAEVTCQPKYYYTGNVSIPSTVSYNGKKLNVTRIGGDAFSSCSSLTSVTIPNSVTSIGFAAFYNCEGLTSITIPNSVTTIGREAFENCEGLTSITIPNSVITIGREAFKNCRSLTSVTISNGVTTIGDRAFSSCSNLTSITIPNSVTTIGEYAFDMCWRNLTSVTIPNSVTTIGEHAFDNCSSLTSVFSLIKNPFEIDSAVFSCIAYDATLYVPKGTKSAYKSAGWMRYFSRIVEN